MAVGAPYEDEGKGAIYIFRGGADGIQTEASQKIVASDIQRPGLRGFGIALSRGVDVDGNGYPGTAEARFSGA